MKREHDRHPGTHTADPVATELGELMRTAMPATTGFDAEFVDDTVALARPGLEARRSSGPAIAATRTAAARQPAAPPFRAPLSVPIRYAMTAVVAVLVVVAATLFMLGRTDAPPGQQPVRIVSLPDGSSVLLAVGARVVASPDFPRTRRVSLTGEAFFDVARGDGEFVVDVEQGQIAVTGTRFNVRSWPDALAYTDVALVEGSVEIRRQGGASVSVEPGQHIRFGDSEPAVLSTEEFDNLLAWQTGGFGFQHETVSFVFDEVARRYDTTIVLADTIDEWRRLTYLSPRPGTLNEVLSDLCHALNLRFRAIQGGYEIH